MADFHFKPKKTDIVLRVEREGENGEVESRDLAFECSVSNYSFIKNVIGWGEEISMLSKSISEKSILSIIEKEKQVFEAIAPGQWDEFFAFLDEDIAFMTQLVGLVTNKVIEKGFESKKAEIEPEVPGGEEV